MVDQNHVRVFALGLQLRGYALNSIKGELEIPAQLFEV